jgi:nitrous oxide reductase accessory protein NosL
MEIKRQHLMGKGVTVTDWGKPEYLDGAQMQFMVTVEQLGSVGSCLAYFGEESDALLFAQVKAEELELEALESEER